MYKNPNLFAAPVATNGSLVTAPLLLTDGTNKVSQVQNSMLPNKAVLTLPVKYPIITESGVTIYPDYATGIRGGEYEEAGITKDSNYIDITLQKSIKGKEVIVRINTVDIDKNGNYNYYVEDKQGFLQFFPSGIFENSNCIKRGKVNTVAETESRLMLFKELKKSILKNSMKINRGISTYVGKSIIENKEKYRIPYGSPASSPEDDFDISDMVWKGEGFFH
ncbi:hypothetical protein FUSO7_11785 [Fusobacterium necrophorum BFTR-2]|nr:hypothetical protein [Fusobacterium necrophorum]KDE69323.1 hypothetical protein FUSO7_11785 [Fusobacterium necrophorum BFTR-2]